MTERERRERDGDRETERKRDGESEREKERERERKRRCEGAMGTLFLLALTLLYPDITLVLFSPGSVPRPRHRHGDRG